MSTTKGQAPITQKQTLNQIIINLQGDIGELLASENELQRLLKTHTKDRDKCQPNSRDYRFYDRKIHQLLLYRDIFKKRVDDRRAYLENKEQQIYHFTD